MEEDKSLFVVDESVKADDDMPTMEDTQSETEIDREQKKRKRVLIASGSVLALVVVVAIVSLFVFRPFSKSQQSSSETTYDDYTGITTRKDAADAEFYEKKPNPTDSKGWENVRYNIDENGKVTASDENGDAIENVNLKDMVLSGANPSIVAAAGVLPSEAAGFTSDINQETNDDGSLNPMFAYWTQEEFAYELSLITETLLNPVFGGWSQYTISESKAGENFTLNPKMISMFSQAYLQANAGKPASSWVPVYADWGGNDYGLADTLVPSSSARFYGTIKDAKLDYSYDSNNGQYRATLSASVVFTAWTKDQKTITKNGQLTLGLVSNPNGSANAASPYRVVIDSAELNVE